MKKIKYLIIMLLLVLFPLSSVKAYEKINVYLFRGEGCPHCSAAEKFFESLAEDSEYSKYYNLEKYEVWYNEDNADLMEDVADELDTTANGVPFIVIGEKFFSGYSESRNDEIKKVIKDSYYSSSYKDVVKTVKDGSYEKDDDFYDSKDEIKEEIDEIKDEIGIDDFENEFFAALASFGIAVLFIVLSFALIISIFRIITIWKVFLKAGKNGWEAIIPFYNTWTLFEISGYPGYYSLFILIPIVGFIVYLVFYIMAMISLSKKFHKDPIYALLLILLPLIGFAILAFDSSEYDGSLGEVR